MNCIAVMKCNCENENQFREKWDNVSDWLEVIQAFIYIKDGFSSGS